MMTARQRAMYDRENNAEKDFMVPPETLMSLPTGYKEKVSVLPMPPHQTHFSHHYIISIPGESSNRRGYRTCPGKVGKAESAGGPEARKGPPEDYGAAAEEARVQAEQGQQNEAAATGRADYNLQEHQGPVRRHLPRRL